jgi:lauroyl/myristoyl acyltransferase
MWIRVERRFLADRLSLTTAMSPEVLRIMWTRLRANHIVALGMGPNGARRYTLPFLGGHITLANGAAALAHRTGAALLPVFTVQTDDGSYVTTVEAPLQRTTDADSSDPEEQLIAYGVRLLESSVSRFPDQFNGWSMAAPSP